MRPFRFVALTALAPLALSGCAGVPAAVLSGLGAAASVYSVADKVTTAVDTSITTACAEYEKGKAAAGAVVGTGLVASAASAKVTAIESFGDAACGSGSGPPSGDPLATAIWLGQLAGQITTLTSPAQ
jgi:hypothetical protein